MSVAPSSAQEVHIAPYRSEAEVHLCSNALLLEAAMAFHSNEPFCATIVTAATALVRTLRCIGGSNEELGYLGGNVYEETISSLMTSELAIHFNTLSSKIYSMFDSLPSGPPPDGIDSRLLWAGQMPIILGVKENKSANSKPSQGKMDIALAVEFASGLDRRLKMAGKLPVAFIELTKDGIAQKKVQSFATVVGVSQYLKFACCNVPVLGVMLNATEMHCVAYCPDGKKKLSCVDIFQVAVTQDSMCRLLRTMLLWGVGVQRFMFGPHEFQVQKLFRNVVFSSASFKYVQTTIY